MAAVSTQATRPPARPAGQVQRQRFSDGRLAARLDRLAAIPAGAREARDDNQQAGGWAPAPRTVDDPQPAAGPDGKRRGTYSSLLNPQIVTALAADRLGSAR